MSATNKDTGEQKNNTSTFISAFVVGLVTLAVFLAIFFALYSRARSVFQPRNVLAPPSKRAPDLPTHLVGWFTFIWREPEISVLHINGPDAYFFLRFMRLMLEIFVPFWFITWAILMPVSATGGVGNPGLNMFTFGNIAGTRQNHHIAHLLVGVMFFSTCPFSVL
jgi:calcium permeable stress-gated cation channel